MLGKTITGKTITEERLTELQDAQTEKHRLKLLKRWQEAKAEKLQLVEKAAEAESRMCEIEFIYGAYYGPLPQEEA